MSFQELNKASAFCWKYIIGSVELGVFVEMTPAYPGAPLVAHFPSYLKKKCFKVRDKLCNRCRSVSTRCRLPRRWSSNFFLLCFVFFVPRLWRLTWMMVFKDVKVTLTCEIGCNQPRNSQQPRFQGCSLLNCSEIPKRKLLMMKLGGVFFVFFPSLHKALKHKTVAG